MPQIDTYTFFSQVFWLVVIFSSFYILVLNNVLPNIARVLKLRRKQITAGEGSVISEEHKAVMDATSGALESSLKDSTTFLSTVRNSSSEWLTASLTEANEKTLLELNKTYLKNIGELKGQSFLISDIIKQK
jgi:F-type H+-transporting ATPase subunit b